MWKKKAMRWLNTCSCVSNWTELNGGDDKKCWTNDGITLAPYGLFIVLSCHTSSVALSEGDFY